MKWLCYSLLCITDFGTKTDTGDKMKYFKNTKRQQENGSNGHAENYLQTTEINWDKCGIGQK